MQTEREYRLALRRTVLCGALLRALLLILLLTLLRSYAAPYLMADDAAYEALAARYLALCERAIDPQALVLVGATAYLEPLWPVVVCILAGLTGRVAAARWLNVLLSVATVGVVAGLARRMTGSMTAALRAARLMAYLPLTVITSLFPIKDIYLMLAFFSVMLLLARTVRGERVGVIPWLLCAALTWGCFDTRRPVGILLVALAVLFLLLRCLRRRRVGAFLVLAVGAMALLWCTREAIFSEITEKLQAYGGADAGQGGISFLQIRSLRDVWRLPFAYVFAMLQPVRLPLLTPSGMTPYWDVLSLLNLSMLPVASASALYAFCKKQERLLWLVGLLTYTAVILLSLGTFRHYLFLLPLQIVNAAAYKERAGDTGGLLAAIGSAALLLLLSLYSMR